MALSPRETAARMIRIARDAAWDRSETVVVNMTPQEVKTISGAKRTSARMEERIGRELVAQGHGNRGANGIFSVFSESGCTPLSFSEAISAGTDEE